MIRWVSNRLIDVIDTTRICHSTEEWIRPSRALVGMCENGGGLGSLGSREAREGGYKPTTGRMKSVRTV